MQPRRESSDRCGAAGQHLIRERLSNAGQPYLSAAFVWQDRYVVERGDHATLIATDRLVVRPWHVEEVDRFVDLYSRPEVLRWFPAARPLDRLEAVERIERSLAQFAADARFGRWAVVDRASGVPAGTVILQPLPDGGGEVEIGWHLHPDSCGKGFASEAAAAVLRRGFADGLPEVWAVTDVENDRSAAVCRRIGMRLLGVTHRWYHEASLMFWAGAGPDQEPSLGPDRPAPAQLLNDRRSPHREGSSP